MVSQMIETIWKSLEKYAQQYVKIAVESIRLNSHTHKLGSDVKPPQDAINKCVFTFVKFCQQDEEFWKGQTTTPQILDTLLGFARSFPKQQEGTKAIIVDFINYIGTINGLNYSLQTSDIYAIPKK
jgi:hypothetical protein